MSLDGSDSNGPSTVNPVQEREPAHVQHLLELHLVSRGSNLRELAVLAPVLLNQVCQANAKLRNDLCRGIPRVWEN